MKTLTKRVHHVVIDEVGTIIVFDDEIEAKHYAEKIGAWYGTLYNNKKFIKRQPHGLVVEKLE